MQLMKLNELTNDDYYFEFYSDGSSMIKLIGLEGWYIHNFSIFELKENLDKLIIKFENM